MAMNDRWNEKREENPGRDWLSMTVVTALILTIFALVWFGLTACDSETVQSVSQEAASDQVQASPQPTMRADDAPSVSSSSASPQAAGAVTELQVQTTQPNTSEEPVEEATDVEEYEEAYYEEDYVYYDYEPVYYGGYSGGSTATDLHTLLNGQGRAYHDGTSYTWYPNDIGNGSIEGRIPGCHYDDSGVAYDQDGYIAVASDDYATGDVISTPYGDARVYDHGSGYGNIDIYTNK